MSKVTPSTQAVQYKKTGLNLFDKFCFCQSLSFSCMLNRKMIQFRWSLLVSFGFVKQVKDRNMSVVIYLMGSHLMQVKWKFSTKLSSFVPKICEFLTYFLEHPTPSTIYCLRT